MASSNIPAALAQVDDQKNAETCSLFAISKAVCNGFEMDKFFPGYLDFDQGRITTGLLCQINDAVSIAINIMGKVFISFFHIKIKSAHIFAEIREVNISIRAYLFLESFES